MTEKSRKLLAISDDTEECATALVFAGLRAAAVHAGLVLLRCVRAPGVGGWIGLDKEISRDAVDSARLKMVAHAELVETRTGVKPEIQIIEDDPVDAIRALVDKDPAIKVLVLASSFGRGGPGPLVSRLGKGRALANRPIAVTVIPGDLTPAQLDEIGGLTG